MNQTQRQCRHGKMVFSPNDHYIGRALDKYGEYSEGEVRLFADLIPQLGPHPIVLDVGANIGALTLPLARIAPGGLILAFEPQRVCYYTLCTNMVLNGVFNVHCFQKAVGEQPGTVTIPDLDYSFHGNYGAMSLLKSETELLKRYNPTQVEVMVLDHLLLARCDFVKIDVEGMELAALKGAESTIRSHHPILYVENDRAEQIKSLVTLLDGWGYKVYQHFPQLFNPDNFAKKAENIYGSTASGNMLCIPHPREIGVDMTKHGLFEARVDGNKFLMTRGAERMAMDLPV